MMEAIRRLRRLAQGGTLGTQTAAVGRVIRIASNAGYPAVFGFDQHAAADAAVATSGFDFGSHDFPSGHAWSNTHAI
jgi:hypothetical protein